MTTRVEIVHRTGFRYAGPVTASYNEARMTPMTTPTQQTLRARIDVQPVSWETSYLDYWGTQVTAFEVHQPHEQLEVTASSVVELGEPLAGLAPDEPRVGWDTLAEPRVRDEHVEMLIGTALTEPPDELVEAVAGLRRAGSPDEVARAVCDLVHERIEYVPGSTEVRATAADAWAAGSGVCQDLAHITLGGLRAAGIPARYVSGYFDPRREPPLGEAATAQSHAWVEWWAGDWTPFDPTNAIVPDQRHVVVARGRDYADVTPLKGIYSGGSTAEQNEMFVQVRIRRIS